MKSIIKELCNKDIKKRLGAKGGITEIFAHTWCYDLKVFFIKIFKPIKIEGVFDFYHLIINIELISGCY